MSTYTLEGAEALMKDVYVGPIVEQINQKTYAIDQIERDSAHLDGSGKRSIIPVHMNRNRGRGSRGDNADLPVPGHQEDKDAIVKTRYHYYGMEISDPAVEGSKTTQGAFANLMTRETQALAQDMRKDMNRQVFGNGTGALTALRATSKEKTIKVTSVQGIGVGDRIDILKTADGTAINSNNKNVEVVKRTAGSEPSIELSAEITGEPTTAYSVYLAGSYKKEMDGLRNIIDTNRTLHEINSETAGNSFWNAGSKINAEEAVAGESLFERMLDEVGVNGNGEVETILTTRGIKRRLADTYQSQKRFNDARATTVHGGYTAIYVNEIPVIFDDDCPKGYAFGINKDSLKWFELTKPGWLSQNGVIFEKKVSETAGLKMNVWQAWFRWYCALGCVAPNRNGVIYNCKDDTPS